MVRVDTVILVPETLNVKREMFYKYIYMYMSIYILLWILIKKSLKATI